MKYLCGLLVLFFCCQAFQEAAAQSQTLSFTEFKFGSLRPEDTDAGLLLGVSTGRKLDDKLYWGIEVNYFNSSFRKETTIADSTGGGITFTQKEVELDFSTRLLMLFFQVSYELKVGPDSPLYYRASGSGGWEFIWNRENNFIEGVERTRFFNGLGWQITTGMGVRISRAGLLFVDVMYNNARARKSETPRQGLPTSSEIDLSGLGFRVGINVIGVGF